MQATVVAGAPVPRCGKAPLPVLCRVALTHTRAVWRVGRGPGARRCSWPLRECVHRRAHHCSIFQQSFEYVSQFAGKTEDRSVTVDAYYALRRYAAGIPARCKA